MLPKKSQLQPLELSPDFKYALDVVEKSERSVFVTGRAGTGKSTLLQLFRNTTRKRVAVLAPTGIAALNVRGQTIHSFFAFPPKVIQKGDIKKSRQRKKFMNIDVIIIDEISMVRADLLDGIDMFLRLNREDPRPFGGVQMAFFGDLFQLPPVVSRRAEKEYFATYYTTPYFFSAHVLTSGQVPLEMIELGKVYRQDEKYFIRLLDAIRLRTIDHEELSDLNLRYKPNFEAKASYITLCSLNAIADQINSSNLRDLPTPQLKYQADLSGDFDPRLFPTQQFLVLKEGAQVMMLRNDPQKRFVNGSIAMITHLDDETIKVRMLSGDTEGDVFEVERFEWEMLKYEYNLAQRKLDTKVIGTFTQYPIKLAWAITIHKSQGKTFDRVIIDLGRGAFEFGQTYVALSRCRTLDRIVLKRPLKYSDIMVDERILDFYDGLRRYLPE